MKNVIIKTETQDQWDTVTELLSLKWKGGLWKYYGNESCIYLNSEDNQYSDYNFYKKKWLFL